MHGTTQNNVLGALLVVGLTTAAWYMYTSKKSRKASDNSRDATDDTKSNESHRLVESNDEVSNEASLNSVSSGFNYPVTTRGDVVETLHGREIADPYRWLEDPDSPETKAWVDSQVKCTDTYLSTLSSRDKFKTRMAELINYDQYGTPFRRGSWIFFMKKAGLQNQYVLYKQRSLTAPATVLLDPNVLAADGTVSIATYAVSEDGNKLAYGVQKCGSDWVTIHVRDVSSGNDEADVVEWVKFSGISWTHDNKGFFFSRYPSREVVSGSAGTDTDAMEHQKLFYHTLASADSPAAGQDVLVMEMPHEPKWMFGGEVTDDGATLVVTVSRDCNPVNLVYLLSLSKFKPKAGARDGRACGIGHAVALVPEFTASYDYVTNEGSDYYFLTNGSAPRYRLIKVTVPLMANPGKAALAAALTSAEVIVPEAEDKAVLEVVAPVGGATASGSPCSLVLCYLRDVKEELELCDLSGGNRRPLHLPSMGSVGRVRTHRGDDEFFFSLTSFLVPGTTYRCVLTPAEPAANQQSRGRSSRSPTGRGGSGKASPPRSKSPSARRSRSRSPGRAAAQGKAARTGGSASPSNFTKPAAGGGGGGAGSSKGGRSPKGLSVSIDAAEAGPRRGGGRLPVSHSPKIRLEAEQTDGNAALGEHPAEGYCLEVVQEMRISGFDPALFEVRQEFYASKDGTRVPMFIVSAKRAPGQPRLPAPCQLYGYGGFNISITPSFSVSTLLFVSNFGGVLAVANLRGGGEYGEEWHKAGTVHNKQNVFDDFCAAARHLIDTGVTSPQQLAIRGGSNGGLLVAACVTQNPELFAAAVAQVPVIDMLRFHKFTIGSAWCSDYGCADDEDEFKTQLSYSPLHNVRAEAGKYPHLLVCTADHDDRVSPLHSFKFIAEVQHTVGSATGQTNPLLIRIETKAGHGGGKPTEKVIEEYADVYSFIAAATGAQWRG